jgi:hypothetical protein
MAKVIPMHGKHAPAKAKEDARFLAAVVFEALPLLLPKANVAERRKLAADMLAVARGTRARLTPEVLTELLMVHSSCVMDQKGRCPLLLSVRSLTWEINQFCGCGNEEDKAFKRHDPMCAARPLTVRFDREEE